MRPTILPREHENKQNENSPSDAAYGSSILTKAEINTIPSDEMEVSSRAASSQPISRRANSIERTLFMEPVFNSVSKPVFNDTTGAQTGRDTNYGSERTTGALSGAQTNTLVPVTAKLGLPKQGRAEGDGNLDATLANSSPCDGRSPTTDNVRRVDRHGGGGKDSSSLKPELKD